MYDTLELPNDFNERDWSFFEVDIEARDRFYAIGRVQGLVEMRLAEINFYANLWGAGIPQPAASGRAPNERWSRLQLPQFFLLFNGPDYLLYSGMDYDYRRTAGPIHFRDRVDSLIDIPCYDYDAEKNTYDGYIVSALLAYQNGITERSVRQSFFSFWRGIEILSNTRDYREMVERGEFAVAFEHESGGQLRPRLQDAIDELEEKRHELVHEGLKTDVNRNHRNAAKLLLDGLLLLYIDMREMWDVDEIETFLKYGVEYEHAFRFITTLIPRFQNQQT